MTNELIEQVREEAQQEKLARWNLEDELQAKDAEIARLRNAISLLGELTIVSGDAAKRLEPNASYNLNSYESWIVCGKHKSAHKLRAAIEQIKQALGETNAD